jgi:hypothetical protein
MAENIRKFIWLGVNADGFQDLGELKGVSLLEAIIAELRDSGSCIYWDDGCCENWASLPVEDKAKRVLWNIEESFVEGTSANQISVIDITDHDNPIVVFPLDMRPSNFTTDILGIRYVIKAWIPADPEDPEIYNSMESAENELNQLQLMQPENRYEIHDITTDSED